MADTVLIVLICVFLFIGIVSASVEAYLRWNRLGYDRMFTLRCWVGNFLWVSTGGWVYPLFYLAWGGILMSCFDYEIGEHFLSLAMYAFLPFGRAFTESKDEQAKALSMYQYKVWCGLVGIWMSVLHLALALVFACTIVLFPLAVRHYRLVTVSAFPIGTEVNDLRNNEERLNADEETNIASQLYDENYHSQSQEDSSAAASPTARVSTSRR
jgi:uncharacterized membrane protein YccF (DUF307 family)